MSTLNRRTFIKASALSGREFLPGMSWLTTSSRAITDPQNPVRINAYLKIDPDVRVTTFSPNPEIGQNVKTSMPIVVAEELDLVWNDVTVKQASLDTSRFTRQLAGGSQSIRQTWQTLRTAGATARHMLSVAADQVFDPIYAAPFLAHNTLEPMNFFAYVKDEGTELIGPVQTPEALRASVARKQGGRRETLGRRLDLDVSESVRLGST